MLPFIEVLGKQIPMYSVMTLLGAGLGLLYFKLREKKLHGQKRNSVGGNWRMRVGNSQCFGKRTIAAAHAEAAKPSERVE